MIKITIEEIRKEYEAQDNAGTSYPIFVTVQERHCVGVIQEGFSVCCPYGDGETEIEYYHPEMGSTYKTKEECLKAVQEYFEDDFKDEKDNIVELNMGYIWVDKEWFLTRKAALDYMKVNAHNLGKTRTFIHHFEIRNWEMRKLLSDINFKTR